MILLNSLQSLKIVLAGAVATNEPHIYGSAVDLTATGLGPVDPTAGTTDGATAVALVAAPAAGSIRQVKYLSCFNTDTAPVVATVFIDNDGDARTMLSVTLAPGERLEYADGVGFKLPSAGGTGPGLPFTIVGAADFTPALAYPVAVGDMLMIFSGSGAEGDPYVFSNLPLASTVQGLIDAHGPAMVDVWFSGKTLNNIPAATDEADAFVKFNDLLSLLKLKGYMAAD